MSSQISFSSAFGPSMSDYLALKRGLGRAYTVEAHVLAQLDRFLVDRTETSAHLTSDSFEAWCITLRHLTPTVRRNRMRIVRNLCLYVRRFHPGCFLPDIAGFPAPAPPRRPFIFSEQQILRLLQVAGQLRPCSTSPLHSEVYRLAIVLLYTAGLRRGELVRLLVSDYDANERTVAVRASKFHKSRIVALSDDAAEELESYLRVRRQLPCRPESPLLVSRSGGLKAYTGAGLGRGLQCLFRRSGVLMPNGRPPRVHDLRHTYAVHALLRWYREGVDVQARLPVLATAMGHVSIASTAYYLAYFEPLVQAACERFHHHSKAILPSVPSDGGEP